MFKKMSLITAVLCMAASVFACWFTQENFNNAYIAGVNFYKEHYDGKATVLEQAVYANGQQVTLPLTVWFKVSPRIGYVNNIPRKYQIMTTRLYYKIVPKVNNTYNYNSSSYKWRLAKSIEMGANPKWSLDFTNPVQLFGKTTLTLKMITSKGDTIKSGDAIVFAWYVQDTGALSNAQDITPGSAQPYIWPADSQNSSVEHANQFYPSHVFRVIYNGSSTPKR